MSGRSVVLIGTLILAAPATVVEDVGLTVRVQPMLIVDGQSGALASRRLDVPAERESRLEIKLQWPRPDSTSRLKLRAKGVAGPPEGVHALHVSSELILPDGEVFRAAREMRLREGSTGFFEVYREGNDGLTLALTAERRVEHRAVIGPSVGAPVVFKLEVDGVYGERHVALETNHLSTFLGEPVEYSFQHGAGDAAESVLLYLTPVRREGELVEVRIEVSGHLPGGDTRLVLSRRETLFTTRGATSSVTVTNGTPPAGYRFRITPDF